MLKSHTELLTNFKKNRNDGDKGMKILLLLFGRSFNKVLNSDFNQTILETIPLCTASK